MFVRLFISVGIILACGLLAACPRSSELAAGPGAKAQDPLAAAAEVLDRSVSKGTVRGYAFVLADEQGRRWQRAGGMDRQGSAFTPERVVELASSSKALAAAAIMTLVDRHLLNLDLPIHYYLAGTPVNWPSSGALDRKAGITLRMLLAHTSGLPGLNETPACVGNPNFEGGLEACVRIIAGNATPLRAAPGEVFMYGGTGYQVAGYVAQVVAGAPSWQAFFESALAQPLGHAGVLQYETGGNPRIAGGALGHALAYADFLRMLLRGGVAGDDDNSTRVLAARSVSELRRNQLGPPAATEAIDTYSAPNSYTPYALAGADYPYYGLGFFLEAPPLYQDEDYYSPGPEVSDQGLYGTTPWLDFGLDYTAVLVLDEEATPTGATPSTSAPSTALQKGVALWNELRPWLIRYYSDPSQREE